MRRDTRRAYRHVHDGHAIEEHRWAEQQWLGMLLFTQPQARRAVYRRKFANGRVPNSA